MLENKYDWKISKADQNSNVYYYFPKDEDEFKEAVVKNGGMSVYVYQDDKLIDEFYTKSRGYRWTSPVFNYLKTMSKNGKYFYR
ncbi:AAA family ATPase, partial [Campylobacter coli]|nr:AAA family ATPase [Campylobacter coli]